MWCTQETAHISAALIRWNSTSPLAIGTCWTVYGADFVSTLYGRPLTNQPNSPPYTSLTRRRHLSLCFVLPRWVKPLDCMNRRVRMSQVGWVSITYGSMLTNLSSADVAFDCYERSSTADQLNISQQTFRRCIDPCSRAWHLCQDAESMTLNLWAAIMTLVSTCFAFMPTAIRPSVCSSDIR